MITLSCARACTTPREMFEKATNVVAHYGFKSLEDVPTKERGVAMCSIKDVACLRRDERSLVSIARTYTTRGVHRVQSPTLLWNTVPRDGSLVLQLHALNVPSAIAESYLIATAYAIAGDIGITKRSIFLNSFGLKESTQRYLRDIGTFLKKNAEHVPATLRTRLPQEVLPVFASLVEKAHPLVARAPSAVDYLNEEERKHLWSVFEYLEELGAEYELDPAVIGSHECWNHTMYDIRYVDEETGARIPFARGGRYDALLSRLTGAQAYGATIAVEFDLKHQPRTTARTYTPHLYLAHLGVEAKRRSLNIIEMLRQAGIPVHQSFMYEQLAPQMRVAKELSVPWLLIMGHKEAMEGVVSVRDVRTNTQEPVPIPQLVGYLRRRRAFA